MLLEFFINVQNTTQEVNAANFGVRLEILYDKGQQHTNHLSSMGRQYT